MVAQANRLQFVEAKCLRGAQHLNIIRDKVTSIETDAVNRVGARVVLPTCLGGHGEGSDCLKPNSDNLQHYASMIKYNRDGYFIAVTFVAHANTLQLVEAICLPGTLHLSIIRDMVTSIETRAFHRVGGWVLLPTCLGGR